MSSPEFVNNSESAETDPSLATSEGSGDSGINEAWKPLFDVLPEQYQQMESVREPLKQWDKNYQELQEKYKPFENYQPQAVEQAMLLLNNLNDRPHEVLRLLADNLGVSIAEAKQIVEEQQQTVEPEIEFDENDDPRLVQMQKQLQEYQGRQEEFFQQQVEREQNAMIEREAAVQGQAIDGQVRGILEAGHFGNTAEQQQPFLKVLMPLANMFLQQGSRDPISDAFQQMQGMMGVVRETVQPQKQNQNYLFLPANAGAPPPTNQEGPNLDSEQGRRDFARQIADMALKQG